MGSLLKLLVPNSRHGLARWYLLSACYFGLRAFASAAADSPSRASSNTKCTTVQVQIVHRHGDRSPITPLLDEEYWKSQLVPPIQLAKIAENTVIQRQQGSTGYQHAAGGRGCFGKLSELGLFQMIKVGLDLRKELVDGEGDLIFTPIFTAQSNNPLSKDTLRIVSTDFPRTIQSVQGLLLGLMDEDIIEGTIPIDVRHSSIMIPDPQPRATKEQEQLEAFMVNRPHVLRREAEKFDLALRATKALHPLLAPDAREADFGVVQEHPENMSIETQPLAWNQLAELSKCLTVRDRLPPGLSPRDVEEIGQHTAWRWFETLSHPRLIHLAMNAWTSRQVGYMKDYENQPPLTIWSCHDSSLIGMICAYRLERPHTWPEYASVLLMEVVKVQAEDTANGTPSPVQLMVRFSLNGERLRIQWDKDQEPLDMISLSELDEKIRTVGAESSPKDFQL